MKKLSQFVINIMRRVTIRTRILIVLLIVVLIPSNIIFYITASRITACFLESQNNYWNRSNLCIKNNLGNLIKQIDFYAYNILNHHKIFTYLHKSTTGLEDKQLYIENELSKFINGNSLIKKITIVTFKNEQFNSDKLHSNLDVSMFTNVENLPVIMQIPTLSLNSTDIVQVRTLIDFSTGIKYGYLCIYFDDNAILNCYQNILSPNDACMIIDSKQQIIYSDKNFKQLPLFTILYNTQGSENQYITSTSLINNAYYSKKIKIDSTPTLDWYLVCSFSNAEAQRYIKNLNKVVTTIQIVTLILSLLIIIRLSNKATKDIRSLRTAMNTYPTVHMNQPSSAIRPHDEFAFLENALNDMLERNSELMENIKMNQKMQRDLELQIMQAQINPHFLYNTLDTIGCIAEKHGQLEIRKIIVALASFFRISLSKGNKYITVREELQHVKYYTEIEQFRSNYAFNVIYDIEPEILDKKIIKIILQPLVENAIKHGIGKTDTVGQIKITGFMFDNKLHFEVTDNGIGFDTSILENDDTYTGYGYKNVNNRIKLEYGEEYGLKYYSIPNKITRAEVTMGYKETKQKGN